MSGTVLIVDDDPFIRKLIATTLADVAGFDLHEAGDGQHALEVAREITPTIVFLDIEMPRLDGIETCRGLRALEREALERGEHARGSPARIVMLTAAGAEHARTAREAGANLFLTKPFSPLDLLKLVHDLGEA